MKESVPNSKNAGVGTRGEASANVPAWHAGVRAPRGERGFALLVIFLLAASVALMLYMQMPRVAFEAQRDKEQLLIDRGEQYKRAIQEYFVKNRKYPSSIDDLDKSSANNQRFLRRRYIDPMTGKSEWRLIHVNAAGQLTDSLVEKPAGTSGASGASGASGSGGSGASGASGDDGPTVNAAVYQRPSDRTLTPAGPSTPENVDPNDPRYWPPITLAPIQPSGATGPQPGQAPPQLPGLLPGQPPQAGQVPGQTPGQFPGQAPGQPPIQLPGMPGGIPTGQLPGQNPTAPGGQGAFGGQGAPANPVVGAINGMLTGASPAGQPGQNMSGGLAGVASLFKGPSIKIYNTQQKYQNWEFIFKLNNGQPGAPAGGSQGTQNPNGQNPSGASGPGGQTPTAPTSPTLGSSQPNQQQN